MEDSTAPQPADATRSARTRKRRLTPPAWVWIVWAITGAIIVALQATDLTIDHAVANVITLIAGFVALMSAVVWFSCFSGYSRSVRWAPPVAGLSVIGLLAVLLEIEGVSGEMVPVFKWRFAPKADELLDRPDSEQSPGDAAAAVDLRTTTEHDFPRFLGPRGDLTVDHVGLDRDWTGRSPELVWRQEIGAGWSGFSVVGPYAVTMEQRGESEMVTCYEVETGRLCWFHSTPTRYETVLGGVGPRATPTIDDGMVYTLGAGGHLLCLDGAYGRPVWEKNVLDEFGVTREDEESEVPYGRSNSPLVAGPLLIVSAGGTEAGGWVSLVAYDKRTGEQVWQGGRRQVAYASPRLATLGGVEQILIVNQDYASGHDPATGKVLWEHDWPGRSATNANVSQAVPIAPDRVFLSKGYSHGAALVQLVPRDDGTFETEELWYKARVMRTKFSNVTVRDGYVYGLSDGILQCVELASGKSLWKAGRYGHGQILRVDDLLLVLSDSGELLLVEATPERRNHVLGRLQAIEGKTWNNLALSGPYLLVRNGREAACYRLPLVER